MARIVLVTAGSFGDLFPTLGLAAGLQARGHRAIVASTPHYRERVEALGLEFSPVRPDLDPADPEILRRAMDPVRGSENVVRELAMPYLRDSYDDVSLAIREADLVLTHPITFAAPIAAEVLRVPWMSTVLAPLSFFSAFDFPLLPPLPGLVKVLRARPWSARLFLRLAKAITRSWTEPVRRLRRSVGLPSIGDALYEGQFSPRGTLALFSPALGAPQPDWPPHVFVTGFVFHDGSGPVPPELDAFLAAGDPPIVFTLGSSAVGVAGAFYRESAAAAAMVGRRAVLLIGRQPENRTRDLPAEAIAVEYAPHEPLLSGAAAVVHHGGVGTLGQVLRAGRPMLVVPFAHDQPDNAFRAERLGVSRTVRLARYRRDAVASELRVLLGNATYAERAAEVGRAVRAEDGVGAACEAIDLALNR